jgi:hypothetical protein
MTPQEKFRPLFDAYAAYERNDKPRLDALWAAAASDEDVAACQQAEEEVRLKLAEVWYECTQGINTKDTVLRFAQIGDVRNLIAKLS